MSDNEVNKTFISTIGNFNDVLQSLNKEHSGNDGLSKSLLDVIKKEGGKAEGGKAGRKERKETPQTESRS